MKITFEKYTYLQYHIMKSGNDQPKAKNSFLIFGKKKKRKKRNLAVIATADRSENNYEMPLV